MDALGILSGLSPIILAKSLYPVLVLLLKTSNYLTSLFFNIKHLVNIFLSNFGRPEPFFLL
ncbi:MAG: hypothetical protein ACTSRP_01270 [Candidatus Helarchaeota archaeon]